MDAQSTNYQMILSWRHSITAGSHLTVVAAENALKKLKSDLCCGWGAIEGDIRSYPRQYADVVVGGVKYIYINAGVSSTGKISIVCDGGKSFWGVLYNPETKRFSALAFNGSA